MKDNKLIAEFMGVQYKSDEDYFKELAEMREDGIFYEQGYMESQLNYHKSWGWLMPVVEKIECTTIDNNDNSDNFFNVMIDVFECNINGGNICICENGNTKLEATYKAVVEFIKQHNKES